MSRSLDDLVKRIAFSSDHNRGDEVSVESDGTFSTAKELGTGVVDTAQSQIKLGEIVFGKNKTGKLETSTLNLYREEPFSPVIPIPETRPVDSDWNQPCSNSEGVASSSHNLKQEILEQLSSKKKPREESYDSLGKYSSSSLPNKKYKLFLVPRDLQKRVTICGTFIGQGTTFCTSFKCSVNHREIGKVTFNVGDLFVAASGQNRAFCEPTLSSLVLSEEVLNSWIKD